MTKAQIKQALQAAIDAKHAEAKSRVEAMSEKSYHPQVACMIEKNKGYMLALEDVTELLYSRGIF